VGSQQRKARKQFFFEKKNQKTFDSLEATASEQKFFVSFFQKRNTSLLQAAFSPATLVRVRNVTHSSALVG
jgi:hypothetical protein